MKFIALKTKDGKWKGDISFCCRVLHVSRQGFYQYLANKDRPWKDQPLADAMMEIYQEDECNDIYGRIRMYQTLILKPLTKCVTDITEIKASGGKLYVSAVFDCFDLT